MTLGIGLTYWARSAPAAPPKYVDLSIYTVFFFPWDFSRNTEQNVLTSEAFVFLGPSGCQEHMSVLFKNKIACLFFFKTSFTRATLPGKARALTS